MTTRLRTAAIFGSLLALHGISGTTASTAGTRPSGSNTVHVFRGVTVHVFHARRATPRLLVYRLHGLRHRNVVAVSLWGRRGKHAVVKRIPVTQSRVAKAASVPLVTVAQHSRTLTVARPASLGPASTTRPPLLMVWVQPTATTPCGWTIAASSVSAGERPAACWRPYSDDSPFNMVLPEASRLAPNSEAIVSKVLSYGGAQHMTAGWAGTEHDWARPTYFSSPTDPEFTLHCLKDWGRCGIEGDTVRIPDAAKPAGGGDAHMTIIDPATGWEYDLWQVSRKPDGGGQLDFSYGGRTMIDGDGIGADRMTGVAASWGDAAGLVRAEELEAGQINHVLFMTVPCDNGSFVYPAKHSGYPCPEAERASAPAMGQRFQLNMTEAQIAGLPVPEWKKTLLRAMARYGMVVGDTGGDAWAIAWESGVQYTSFGKPDRWVELAKRWKLPYSPEDGAYAFNLRDGVDWAHTLRVIDPCVSARSC